MRTFVIPESLLDRYEKMDRISIFVMAERDPARAGRHGGRTESAGYVTPEDPSRPDREDLQVDSLIPGDLQSNSPVPRGHESNPTDSRNGYSLNAASSGLQDALLLGDIIDVRTKSENRRKGLLEVISIKKCAISNISQEDYDNAIENINSGRAVVNYFKYLINSSAHPSGDSFKSSRKGFGSDISLRTVVYVVTFRKFDYDLNSLNRRRSGSVRLRK